jgi:hypothetical protein
MTKKSFPCGRSLLCAPLISSGLLMLAPAARADWVIVKLGATCTTTSKSRQADNAFTPASLYPMTASVYVEPSGPPGSNSIFKSSYAYMPQTSYNLALTGEAVSEVELSNITVTLEWQGGGTWSDKGAYLRVLSQASAWAGTSEDSKTVGPSWSILADTGIVKVQDSNTIGPPPPPPTPFDPPNTAFSDWYFSIIASGYDNHADQDYIRIDTSQPSFANGIPTVEKTIGLTPTGNGQVTTQNGWANSTHAESSAGFSAWVTDEAVVISSSIEPSRRKSMKAPTPPVAPHGAPPPPLPDPVPGTNPPAWIRNVGADETQESAATPQWVTGTNPTAPGRKTLQWYGTGVFDAHIKGFTNPQYEWQSGSISSGSTTNQLVVTDNPLAIGPTAQTLELGEGNEPSTSSTTFGVKVSGLDVTNNPLVLEDKYTVNWHQPDENWVKKSQVIHTPFVDSISPDRPNGTSFKFTPLQAVTDYNYRNGTKVGVVVWDTGVNLYKLLVPGAKVAAGIGALLKSAASVAVTYEDTQVVPKESIDANFNDFKNDFLTLDGDANGNAEVTPMTSGISPTKMEEIVYRLRHEGNHATTNDDWKSGSLMLQIDVIYPQRTEYWESDAYDEHGYSGLSQHSVKRIGGRSIVRTWSWVPNPTTSNMAPTPPLDDDSTQDSEKSESSL